MPSRKIVCLGGGSRYFTRALGDLAVAEGLAGSEITLYDIDVEKAERMARHGARLATESGTGLRVRACADLADAIDGADFAISSIGGAGPSVGGVYGTSAHRQDLRIPARYGIYQVVGDTGGPAGMMMGLRSIPAYLHICREMEQRCPEVVFLNHSNPMAVLCRAMIKYSGIQRVIGICHGVQGGIIRAAHLLGVPPEELETVWIGTNHYHWFLRMRHQGRDVYPEFRRCMTERSHPEGERMTARLSEIYGWHIVYPDDGHAIEFYPFQTQLASAAELREDYQRHIGGVYENLEAPDPPPPTAEEQQAARARDLEEFADHLAQVSLPARASHPVTGEGLGCLLENIACGRRRVHIVNVPNAGSVTNLPDYAVLELEGVTDSCGVRPIGVGAAPLSLMGLLQKRIAWQELVADAGATGDRSLALQALLLDEMAILPEKAEAMLDELLHASREWLPQFRGSCS
jgi:alpha-galactosidase